ncbi:MAG TPA: hypothetical protein VLY03_00015 [Bacteroidota bacterium]|nr:hypothetical protein [Bacteroidota bacterium]
MSNDDLWIMEDENKLKLFLKWAGLAALVAIPVMVILKKRKEQDSRLPDDDDSDIFASELEE